MDVATDPWTKFVHKKLIEVDLLKGSSSLYMTLARELNLASSTTHYWFHPGGGKPSVKQLDRLRALLKIKSGSAEQLKLFRLWAKRPTRGAA
tara:strand:+ start:351 stop:626 length:276 start_codon:yes stop_codon:yes gene_type:complete